MELFDTHAHLDDEQLAGQLSDVLARARQVGVSHVVAVGTTAASSEACVRMAAEQPRVFAAVGIQPNYCADAVEADWARIVQLATREKVVALGETGLDRYWDYAPLDVQQDYFDRHLRLSQQTGLPFIVHMRDSGPEILDMLRVARRRGPLRGVMHSFSGSADLMREFVGLGLHISFAGMVTFKKSDQLRSVAAAVPTDRLLVETDAPYLSPHPHRGQRPNEPALLVHTAQCLAEVRGVPGDDLARQTTANACRLFGLEPKPGG
jgi:TatD DNase family protein